MPRIPGDIAERPKSSEVGFLNVNVMTKTDNRTRWKNLRFQPDEYQLLEGRFKKTPFRKLSEYMRSVLLEKPVTVFYRDKAMDDVLEEMILLRKVVQQCQGKPGHIGGGRHLLCIREAGRVAELAERLWRCPQGRAGARR